MVMPNSDYKLHDSLNPKIWEGESLRKDVQVALLKIALEFFKFLEVDVKLVDVIVSGSQANFNYTKHSDLDLHLIVDYSKISCELPVDELFEAKRLLWKEQHDVTVHSIPVELYVEDLAKPAVSSVYSILSNRWLKQPSRDIKPVDMQRVKQATARWHRIIALCLKKPNLSTCRKVKDMLKMYRQTGLAKGGEFNTANLVYKNLRNAGLVEKLMNTIRHLHDREMSL